MSTVAAGMAAPPALIAVVLVLRYLPDAVLTLLAGITALLSRNPVRVRRAMAVLRLLRARDDESPEPPS
ncbi:MULTISPECIES: hypothetical protein [Frankia]|uniref:Uncharacterized protein n=1 Tax=Frankia alni (strain DSM 45986 / CECT 9034 / ACN14a) TaxID=326424 RepID=Q0REQ3_FRAAA|nr:MULTISPECIES: hypothetical protein [Frankia]CAJ64054.1 hypothetical protein FRAAL5421 [Frankia alni ACN14a]